MNSVRPSRLLALSFALLMLGMPILLVAGAASSPTSGYVTYQVTMNGQGSLPNSFLLNYSSAQSSNENGFVTLALGILSNAQNLTYSKLMNVSSLPEIFPYVPGVTNQSFSYSTHGMSTSARIWGTGTAPVTFDNKNYSGQKYLLDFGLTNATSGKTVSASGVLLALPSGLLYSVALQQAGSNGATLTVQLVATNLPVSGPSNSVSTTEGTALVGAGVLGAAAIAVPWKLRKRKQNPSASASSEKPSYWVD